jgi:hypothetical protein
MRVVRTRRRTPLLASEGTISMAEITNKEWRTISESDFVSADLLRAVDAVDEARDYLNDGDDGRPPDLRTDLLRLHQLAMAVFNEGARSQVGSMFEKAVELEDQVDDLIVILERVRETLSQLTALYPESLSYAS